MLPLKGDIINQVATQHSHSFSCRLITCVLTDPTIRKVRGIYSTCV